MNKIQRIQIDNIVKISSKTEIDNYFKSIIIRAQPRIYNRYGCIKLTFTKDREKDIYYLLSLFWHLGLVPKELNRLKEGFRVGRGVLIGEAYEIVLVKTGATSFEDDEEFHDWIKKEWEEKVRHGSEQRH